MSLWQWSTIAANNATADPSINWQEGQAPSTVNDSARAMMAAIAVQFQNGWEWLQYGDTPTYVNATQFTVPTNLTARYSAGRRVKATVSAGTVYGTISASTYTSSTAVTVVWDSGSLDSGLSEVDVGEFNPLNPSLPFGTFMGNGGASFLTISDTTNSSQGANLKLIGNGATTPSKSIRAFNGAFQLVNNAYNNVLLNIDDSGNLTATGNLTAASDERLKTDWAPLPDDFIEGLANVKSGTYTRLDTERRQVGVGAQSLRPLLPEAVIESDDGFLSVAYGQAALAACVELAKEVVRLRAYLEPVK